MIDSKPNGYITLITVIGVAAIGTLVAILVLFSGVTSSKTSLGVQQSAQAKAAADGCAELGLAAIQANIAIATPTTSNNTVDATTKAACSYTITGTAPNYTISSTGTVDGSGKNVVRKVTIVLNRVGPTLNIYSWQETP